MKRKDFLRLSGSLAVGTVTTAPAFLVSGCEPVPPVPRETVTEKDVPLLNDIADAILPGKDEVPGAKAAKTGEYMFMMYSDMLKEDDKELMLNGLNRIDADAFELFKSDFGSLEKEKKEFLLKNYHNEAFAYGQQKAAGLPTDDHFYSLYRSLTLSGYFSSEIGSTKARIYNPVPGGFTGCIPLKPGQKPLG
ncbi:gluconate 2-dehydrogenase subunit 3 family protein [Cytophaga sp. FL35]|uniref:gluconate 2-dehydrogenase subunit 3 family protein n=1 Tax=Cytophaga sp. FL35 TaxID=1904456 RepID=UPI001653A309|nr:gluconate 2-dehydrogenase subunit 3 family protein [Cytophaga sp. FL35]MBC7000239.1 gluconate 2-dehydrogenase subunit 3 family protein [Cytophaga sp. FL35]